MRWLVGVGAALAASLVVGCSLVVGSELDGKDREGADGGTDGGTRDGTVPLRDTGPRPDGFVESDSGDIDAGPEPDAGPGCSGARACIPEPPTGWTGPVALFAEPSGADVPACAGAYPTTAGSYFGDLDPGSLTCTCECNPATGISCTGAARICYGSGTTFCVMACLSTVTGPAPGSCTAVSPSGTHAQLHPPAPSSHGSCTPSEAHVRVDPAWGTVAKACGGATTSAEGCDTGETCAPVPAGTVDELCIFQPGDVDCPGDFYTNKHLFFESFSDTRTCSTCSCGAATSQCRGTLNFVNDSAAGPCTILTGSVTSCGTHGSGSKAQYSPSPTGTCPPSASTLSGAVTTSGAITYCCRP